MTLSLFDYIEKDSLESFISFDIFLLRVYLNYTMSKWRVFSECQDEESQPEREFEFSLSQLPDQPQPPLDLLLLHGRLEDEAGSSRPPKQPRVKKQWYSNL